jgi:hypothetical protein
LLEVYKEQDPKHWFIIKLSSMADTDDMKENGLTMCDMEPENMPNFEEPKRNTQLFKNVSNQSFVSFFFVSFRFVLPR